MDAQKARNEADGQAVDPANDPASAAAARHDRDSDVIAPVRPPGVIWFVRHGETDWNASGRLQGRRDTALNRTGERQAAVVGRILTDLIPAPDRACWRASPLSRASRSMELLRGAMGLAPSGYETDERLAEISFGRWEGYPWKEIRARDPAAHAARKVAPWTFTPPDGESYAAVAERLAPAIESLTGDAVIVSHGGVARALLALACGIPVAEAVKFEVWQGRVLRIADGQWRWLPEHLPPGHG